VVDSDTGEIVATTPGHRILSHGQDPEWLVAYTMTTSCRVDGGTPPNTRVAVALSDRPGSG
jgi:hypothetical protein